MEDNTQNERQGGSVTPPVNTEHLVNPPPPAGLSAEDVQRIATAVAALFGRPGASGNSKNPLVSGGPQQVPVPPSAGMHLFLSCGTWGVHAQPHLIFPTSFTRDIRFSVAGFCFGWTCLISLDLVL